VLELEYSIDHYVHSSCEDNFLWRESWWGLTWVALYWVDNTHWVTQLKFISWVEDRERWSYDWVINLEDVQRIVVEWKGLEFVLRWIGSGVVRIWKKKVL